VLTWVHGTYGWHKCKEKPGSLGKSKNQLCWPGRTELIPGAEDKGRRERRGWAGASGGSLELRLSVDMIF
jgi:hypothetical protein